MKPLPIWKADPNVTGMVGAGNDFADHTNIFAWYWLHRRGNYWVDSMGHIRHPIVFFPKQYMLVEYRRERGRE